MKVQVITSLFWIGAMQVTLEWLFHESMLVWFHGNYWTVVITLWLIAIVGAAAWKAIEWIVDLLWFAGDVER